MLLLHGLGGNRDQAMDLLPAAWPGTRIAPDLPGHGSAALHSRQAVGFDAFAILIATFLDRLHTEALIPPGPVPVVGVSMGAGVAVRLAADRRDLVSRLVLVRPTWLDTGSPAHLAPFQAVADLLRRHGSAQGARLFQAGGLYRCLAETAPATAESLLKQFTRPAAERHVRVLEELPADCPLPSRAHYAALDTDIFVIVSDDPLHPAAVGLTLQKWIPASRIIEIVNKNMDPHAHQRALHDAVIGELDHLN
ncbi:alpha/beta hydrolase [Actinospica robiniae]|uniref:alpha/beta hydrolase n=1 Tax=Actinospica robiniae TaxID=304901 RepID=UPI0005596E35|nr:alpha/beta fold hydrolase [Actinospica robiniae]